MGFKQWIGRAIGEKETPVYKAESERNRDVRTYQLFLNDYGRLYGKVDADFVATAENAPSYRLWLAGRDRGTKDAYQSLPDDVKARYKPVTSNQPRAIASLPEVYNAFMQKQIAIEPAAYALGFDSLEGFNQVINTIAALAHENLTLTQRLDQIEKEKQASAQKAPPVDFTSGLKARKRRKAPEQGEPQGTQDGLVGGTLID